MIFLALLVATSHAALRTDWANVYFCKNADDCLTSKENFGMVGPQAMFVQCKSSKMGASEMMTWNYVNDGQGNNPGGGSGLILLDPFKGMNDWNVAKAISDGTVPRTIPSRSGEYHLASKCCPGYKSDQCIEKRCESIKKRGPCNQLKGCFFKKGKCFELKPPGMCLDFKTKKDCKFAGNPRKSLSEVPTDAVNKKCLWDMSNADKTKHLCRPWVETNCSKLGLTLDQCKDTEGCRVIGKKKPKCRGKRKLTTTYPNYGGSPCEIDQECSCFKGVCAEGWAPPKEAEKPKKECLCMVIGRPYEMHTVSTIAESSEWI